MSQEEWAAYYAQMGYGAGQNTNASQSSTRSGATYQYPTYAVTPSQVSAVTASQAASQATAESQPVTFMSRATVQHAYNRITAKSAESAVDAMWAAVLHATLPSEEGYYSTQQEPPKDGSKKKTDHTVWRCVFGGSSRRILIIEDKAARLAKDNDAWVKAQTQLTNYMLASRQQNLVDDPNNAEQRLFGIVTIGTYSRFYVLQPNANSLAYTNMGDGAYEFNQHAVNIESFLGSMRTIFSPHNSPAGSAASQ